MMYYHRRKKNKGIIQKTEKIKYFKIKLILARYILATELRIAIGPVSQNDHREKIVAWEQDVFQDWLSLQLGQASSVHGK